MRQVALDQNTIANPGSLLPSFMIEEEKKSQDSVSADTAGDLIWTDEPETKYFEEIMGDEEVTERRRGRTAFERMFDRHDRPDDSSVQEDNPNAPMRLAVLGPEEDMSTIAGDTLGDSVVTAGAVLSKDNLAESNLPQTIYGKRPKANPVTRDFKEYDVETPTKKSNKGRRYPYSDPGNDEGTQPETPPRGGEEESSEDDKDIVKHDGKQGDKDTFESSRRPSKRMLLCAGVIGAILILMIGGLAIAFVHIKSENDKNASAGTDSAVEQIDELAGFSPEGFTTVSRAPVATSPPTPPPMQLMTFLPTSEAISEILLSVLASHGIDTDAIVDDQRRPQFRSLTWMSGDPNFENYTDARILQRYALGVLAFGFSSNTARSSFSRPPLDGWLDYETNECEWFSTFNDGPVCDGSGNYRRLVLVDQNLHGTIPTEIGLLSNSLEIFDLRQNRLHGTIPTEVGLLSNLRRFEVVINNLSEEIPSEIGLLSELGNLGAGRNQLNGTLPSEIGLLTRMLSFSVGANNLSGPIPEELRNLENIVYFNLEANSFSGTIPEFLGDWEFLRDLKLGENFFTGPVPPQVCEVERLMSLVADCDWNECPCCTDCTASSDRTPSPTIAVTEAPAVSPTERPSSAPTLPPTPEPTGCTPQLVWEHDDFWCSEPGTPLTFYFENCNPQFGDFIGIYSKDHNPSNLPAPMLWTWSCGSQSCRGTPVKNAVVFDENSVDREQGEWPLRKGDYYAYFIRNSGTPYEAFMESEKIKIKDEGKCFR